MAYKIDVNLNGYDVFFGRYFDSNNEFFIILDENSFITKGSIKEICNALCSYVKEKRKFCLIKALGD